MLKPLFQKDDVMRFYSKKYRFEMKDLRPFAQHTQVKELSSLYNEGVFDDEMRVFLDEIKSKKKQQRRRYREMERKGASYLQPI